MHYLGKADGTIVAEKPNPAISSDVIKEIYTWMSQGASFADVVDRLRSRTVPPGYAYTPWKSGRMDSHSGKFSRVYFQGLMYPAYCNYLEFEDTFWH